MTGKQKLRFKPIFSMFKLNIALILLASGIFAACEQKNTYVEPPPPKVTVAKPLQQEVIDYLEFTGTTHAFEEVEIRARVAGFLQSMDFTPGTRVEKDDLLFVIMGDCDGVRRAHSGRPFENTPYLTYADTHFVIKAEQLLPENVYQLSVEHAVLDTTTEHEVTAFATFATTTFLDIKTSGKALEGKACLTIRKPFDAGQTDL